MLASSDADVKRLLQAIKCCENGSIDSMSRRKLLNKAFSKVQQGLNHATAADHMVNPIALPELPNNTQQLLSHWETEEVFSAKVWASSTQQQHAHA